MNQILKMFGHYEKWGVPVLRDIIDSACGRRAFDTLIRGAMIVNVFDLTVKRGCIGITDGVIAYVGDDEGLKAAEVIDASGMYALPGFVDAHMHIESTMLTPYNFARAVCALGTTTAAADPHEIVNVMGPAGAEALMADAEGAPARILVTAPSTVPSAPGLEGSGCDIDGNAVRGMFSRGGYAGLGEVMDFNGVAAGGERIVSVLEAARETGCLMDGHASVLTGRRLQAFRAAGIDSDHTPRGAAKVKEELALGFSVQLQLMLLDEETIAVINEAPVFDRICLVTDDTSLAHMYEKGHLNYVYERAVELGLDPMRAVRYTTINPAMRLRLYDVGAIAPGMRADIQLVRDIARPRAEKVFFGGRLVAEGGRPLMPPRGWSRTDGNDTFRLAREPRAEDLIIAAPSGAERVFANVIEQDGVSSRTRRKVMCLPVTDGRVDTHGLMKMAVYNRHGADSRAVGLIYGAGEFCGAAALTYGHDCHNLACYGTYDADMLTAMRRVADMGGGLCAVREGRVLAEMPLPVAGLMNGGEPDTVRAGLTAFTDAVRSMGLKHDNPMLFLTLMTLAVSPEIKLGDRGLIDTVNGRLIPLISESEEGLL